MAASLRRKANRQGKVLVAMQAAKHEDELMVMDRVELFYDPMNPPENLMSEKGKYQKIFRPSEEAHQVFYASIFLSPFSEVRFLVATVLRQVQEGSYKPEGLWANYVFPFNVQEKTWMRTSAVATGSAFFRTTALNNHKRLSQIFYSMDWPEFVEDISRHRGTNMSFLAAVLLPKSSQPEKPVMPWEL